MRPSGRGALELKIMPEEERLNGSGMWRRDEVKFDGEKKLGLTILDFPIH